MTEVRPTATGTLRQRPLSHVLLYALDRELTGTLVLESPDGSRSAISLRAGAPVKARAAAPVVVLGQLLLEMGAIDEAALEAGLQRGRTEGRLLGRALLEAQQIDARTLEIALREQLVRTVVWMFGLPEATVYGYYDAVDYLEAWGGEPVVASGLAIVWRGVKAHPDLGRLEQTLDRLGERELCLHADAQISRFAFDSREQAIIDILRVKPLSLPRLIASEVADAETTRRVIYVLAISRHLDLGNPASVPVGSPPPSAQRQRTETPARRGTTPRLRGRTPVSTPHMVAPVSTKPSKPPEVVEQTRAELVALAERLPKMTYYEMLGVEPEAPAAAIQSAFFALAKRWHPDRLAPELADLRDTCARVFARLSEAHQILSNDAQRKEYDELTRAQGAAPEEQEQVQRVLRATTAYQRAQVLLRKNNFAGAEQEARKACEDDPEQADYAALLAWIRAQTAQSDGVALKPLIDQLNAAVKKEPNNERALYYRGQLLKRIGQMSAAARDFRAVVELNPRHVDAARELRLYQMRRQGGGDSVPPPGVTPSAAPDKHEKSGKGLLGKLFKR